MVHRARRLGVEVVTWRFGATRTAGTTAAELGSTGGRAWKVGGDPPALISAAHLPHSRSAGGRDDDMEELALLGSYGDAEGPSSEEEAGMRRGKLRVTGMKCSACTSTVEAVVSARRAVRSAAISLLQNRAHVIFDPALAKHSSQDNS